MKKILVTGPFEGSVTLVYGESGMGAEIHPPLISVDLGAAVLNDVRKRVILNRAPVRYDANFLAAWEGVPVQLTDFDVEMDFEEDFWKPYNKKLNKERCKPLWAKMTNEERSLAVARIGPYNRYLVRKGTAKLDPENYLRRKCWKNDYENIE